jgi:metal-responsive CopG/Arc/MetJ family transcriptional regulator
MSNIKTAISIQESIFEQVETIAQEMKVSRSRLFVLALENFIRDYQDRQLFEAINQACAEISDDPLEQSRLRQIRRQHRRMVEGEW